MGVELANAGGVLNDCLAASDSDATHLIKDKRSGVNVWREGCLQRKTVAGLAGHIGCRATRDGEESREQKRQLKHRKASQRAGGITALSTLRARLSQEVRFAT
jgi:hypothetical protein